MEARLRSSEVAVSGNQQVSLLLSRRRCSCVRRSLVLPPSILHAGSHVLHGLLLTSYVIDNILFAGGSSSHPRGLHDGHLLSLRSHSIVQRKVRLADEDHFADDRH